MKSFLKIVLTLIIIFVLVAGGGVFYLTRGLNSGGKIAINDINLSSISDGTYDGIYKAGRWTNEVNVTVKNHRITKIDLIKDVRFPQKGLAGNLINKVIEKQNINIDAVSGATVTSKAYLKSIENAIEKR